MHKTLYILGTACSRAKHKAVRQAALIAQRHARQIILQRVDKRMLRMFLIRPNVAATAARFRKASAWQRLSKVEIVSHKYLPRSPSPNVAAAAARFVSDSWGPDGIQKRKASKKGKSELCYSFVTRVDPPVWGLGGDGGVQTVSKEESFQKRKVRIVLQFCD